MRLELPPGITALVGPNGSGKSNVVDAVRWCLGEQSIRDLRGQRGEDVIHAGPKRALGAAEVSLNFEASSQHSLHAPELAVARRLFRSGESEYLVNQQKVRLRDLQDALRAIDIDGGRYVVVNQGMTDALLAATPAERRAVLEHAAGLSGYRSRREEARQKLESTAQNVATIEAVLAELEPRLRVLRRQARAVQERDEAVVRLRERLELWYGAQYWALSRRQAELRDESDTVQRDREESVAALRKVEDRAEGALAAERIWQSKIDSSVAAVHVTQREHDGSRFLAREAQQRILTAEARLAELSGRIEQLAATRGDVTRNLVAATETLSESRELVQAHEHSTRELQALHFTITAAVQQEEARVGTAQQAWERARSVCELVTSRLAREQSVADDDAARSHDAGLRLAEAVRHVARIELTVESARDRHQQAASELVDVRHALEEQQVRALGARRRLERIDRLMQSVRQRQSERQRHLVTAGKTIAALDAEMDTGVIAGLDVPPGWEHATAAALGQWATGVSAGEPRFWPEGDKNAWLTWRESCREILPQATWADELLSGLPVDHLNPLWATLLVDDVVAAELAWQALSQLRGHLISSPPLQIVSRDGIVIAALGRESARFDDRAGRFLHLTAEIRTLSSSLARDNDRMSRLAEAREDAARTMHDRDREVSDAAALQPGAETECGDAHQAFLTSESQLTRARADLAHWEESGRQLSEKRVAAAKHLQELAEQLTRAERERDSASLALEQAGNALFRERRRESESGDSLRAASGRLEVMRATEEVQSGLIESLKRDEERLSVECDSLVAEQIRMSTERERHQEEYDSVTQRLDALASSLRKQTANLDALRGERPKYEGNPPGVDQLRLRLSDLISRHERSLAQLEQLALDLQRVCHDASRDLGILPSRLPYPEAPVPSEEEIRRLRTRATQYPDADSSVGDECAALDERYRGLREHLEDLTDASQRLKEIMTVADREMRTQFLTALDTVKLEFSRVFEVMLQGGSATLELVDEEGGIGIQARLPGRRSRSSAAFSGGERSLVALSLLFGVLRIKPTPFCVLDEVDAALDETNVDRYLAVLRHIAAQTQVIVVTHNRATMVAADALYGLTMDDQGVSSLLSLRLDHYEVAG